MESSSSYSSRGAASFFTQANALHRKNLTFQKRNLKTNIGIVAFPIFLCAVIILIQNVVEAEMNKDRHQCGCQGGVCGIQYSSLDQFDSRPISSPFEWPVFLQVPRPESRAVTSDHPTTAGLPDESCKVSQSWPALVIFTGGNQSFAQILAQSLFPSSSSALNLTDFPDSFSTVILGTDTSTGNTQFMEPAFVSDRPLNLIQPQCTSNATSPISFKIANRLIELGKIFSCREQDYTIKQLNEPIEVKIFEWNTGGLLTRIEGLRAFLPKAELMNRIKNFTDLKDNVSRRMYVCIIRIDEATNDLIISEREAWDMMNLKEGTLLEGTMCKILPFGAQIRIGATNRSGLLHISNITRARVSSVSDILKVDEKVKVLVVKSMFPDKISLSIADLESEPGLFLSDRKKVFSEAEEMAQKYRRKLLVISAAHKFEAPPTNLLPFDDEARLYANWKWFKFEQHNEVNDGDNIISEC